MHKLVVLLTGLLLLAVPFSLMAAGEQEIDEDAEVSLTALHYHTPGGATATAIEDIFGRWAAEHPQVESLEIEDVPREEMQSRVLRATLADDLPEILEGDNPWIRAWAEAGVYHDISDYLDEWGEWDSFFPGIRENMTYDDGVYAVQVITNNIALMYNEVLFEEAGIDQPPRTWDEVLEVSETISRELDGVHPIGFSAQDDEEGTWQFLPVLWSNGGSLLELDQPEAIEALEFWKELVDSGYAPGDVVTWGQGDLTPQFMDRQLAMIIQGPWELDWRLPDMEDDFGITHFPTPNPGMMPITAAGGESFGMSSSTPEHVKPIVWDLLEYWMSEDVMVEFAGRTGLLPTRPGALDRILEDDPRLEVFGEQAEYAVGRPAAGGGDRYPEVSDITVEALQSALAGDLSAEEAFTQAAEEIRGAFDDDAHYERERDAARAIIDELLDQ